MQYNVIFDIANLNYPWLKSNIFEIILIAAILLTYFIISKYFKDIIEIKLSFIIMLVAVIIAGSIIFSYFKYLTYQSIKDDYLNRKVKVIEGYVKNVSMQYGRITIQHFTIQNIDFQISDNIITGGYNKTISKGGVIRQNEFIRLHYIEKYNDEKIIIKLEVKK